MPDSKKDVDEWRELYRVVFGREFPDDVWKWKYLENPYNDLDGPLIYVAESNNRIVGANSFMPSIMTMGGGQGRRLFRLCQSNNTMVHPDSRGKGLFLEIVSRFVDEAPGKGYEMIYGYANAQSLPGFMKMKWTCVGQLRGCAVLLDPERILGEQFTRRRVPRLARKALLPAAGTILRLAAPRTRVGKYRLEHGSVDRFAGDMADLFERGGPRQGLFGPRSMEFLTWRFRRPDRDYCAYGLYDSDRMVSYLVVFTDSAARRASIKDIYAPGWDRENLARLLKGTIDHLKGQSYGLLTISLLDREWPLESLFRPRYGVIRSNANEHLVAYPLSREIQPDLLSNRNNWYLQQVDKSPF